jgi:hypothetical protein
MILGTSLKLGWSVHPRASPTIFPSCCSPPSVADSYPCAEREGKDELGSDEGRKGQEKWEQNGN